MSSSFTIEIAWENPTNSFEFKSFSRDHTATFSNNQLLNVSSAAEYHGNEQLSNPEELLAAALASCQMLTFFAIASKSGFIISKYHDKACALLGKNDSGKVSVTEIKLSPTIEFSGDNRPDSARIKSMQELAHKNCFIAQSIKAKVTFN